MNTENVRNPDRGQTEKALTVLQPYAFYISLPDDDPRRKRVENRNWGTDFRGPLAIHAGLSRRLLDDDAEINRLLDRNLYWEESDLAFGAVVATCQLVTCVHLVSFCAAVEQDELSYQELVVRKLCGTARVPLPFEWILDHKHTTGPWCWVLDNVRPVRPPVPARGFQGLWEWRKE